MKRRLSAFLFAALFLLLVAVFYFAWTWWPGADHHRAILDGLLGGLLGATLALLLAWIAWQQLGSISQTASAQFIMELKRDFFTRDTRLLFQLIDNNWLEYTPARNDQAYFRIREDEIRNSGLHTTIIDRLLRRSAYSTYDIDDALLGHFEDIGFLEEEGILTMEMVYQEFSYYIERTWDNSEIRRYIQAEREEVPDLYDKFERMAERCNQRSSRALEEIR